MNKKFHQAQAVPFGAPLHAKEKVSTVHWKKLFLTFFVGVFIWHIPVPEGVTKQAWQLFSIFVATIVGLITRPLPMGAVAFLAMVASILTKTLTLNQAVLGFSNPQIWLVVMACFIARAVIKTGLGKRVSYLFLTFFGKSALGLAYGFSLSAVMLSPVIPSSTARAGGIIMPILKALIETLGSRPDDGTAKKIGTYLTVTTFQATVIATSMFLTASPSNIVAASLAEEIGIDVSWGLWFKAALLPGLLSLLTLPILIYAIMPPTMRKTKSAAKMAREKLHQMGSLKKNELVLLGTLILLLFFWAIGKSIGLHATTTAFAGISLLLVGGVLSWKDLIQEEVAWDTLIWFSILVSMASFLSAFGLVNWVSEQVVWIVRGESWLLSLFFLVLIYFYMHYFFASTTAHVSAMFAPFLGVAIVLGAPPLMVTLLFFFISSLFGGLTHYSCGQAPIIYGTRYVDLKQWWFIGALASVVNLFIYGIIGPFWWKWLGIW